MTGATVWPGQSVAISPTQLSHGTPTGHAQDAEALRDELADLKALIVAAQNGGDLVSSVRDAAVSHQKQISGFGAESHTALQPVDVAQLLAVLGELQAQVATLQKTQSDVAAAPWGGGTDAQGLAPLGTPAAERHAQAETAHDAERLAYLVKHLGYDAQTALTILKAAPDAQVGDDLAVSANPQWNAEAAPESVLYENALVDQILAEMETEMAAVVGQEQTVASTEAPAANIAEYELLSRYFVSAGLPALLKMGADEE